VRPCLKNKLKSIKGWGAWLKCQTQSSNPSTARKKAEIINGDFFIVALDGGTS
jgi:hypothetical protein